MVVAVSVAKEFIAGIRPLAGKGAAAFDALVPITLAGGRSTHDQFADLAVSGFYAAFVDDPKIVSGHGLAGRAQAHIAGPIADEGLEHLGRANAVKQVDARDCAPALAEMARQRFAGGDCKPQTVGAGAAAQCPYARVTKRTTWARRKRSSADAGA